MEVDDVLGARVVAVVELGAVDDGVRVVVGDDVVAEAVVVVRGFVDALVVGILFVIGPAVVVGVVTAGGVGRVRASTESGTGRTRMYTTSVTAKTSITTSVERRKRGCFTAVVSRRRHPRRWAMQCRQLGAPSRSGRAVRG